MSTGDGMFGGRRRGHSREHFANRWPVPPGSLERAADLTPHAANFSHRFLWGRVGRTRFARIYAHVGYDNGVMRAHVHTTLALSLLLTVSAEAQKSKKPVPAAPAAPAVQKIDEGYTAKIKEYTTEKFFLTELVDHLPASDTVPTPEKILGYTIGTPNKLTYTKDIYRYMRALEAASKREKIFSIGKSEEGRDTLIVAGSDEANMAKLDRLKQITARLADPRKTTDDEAKTLLDTEALPFYWAAGSIHSPETGPPEMLMELAYRFPLADLPLISNIRKNML